MPQQTLYPWKQAPFVRLIIPLIAGMLLQWYCPIPVSFCKALGIISTIAIIAFNLRSSFLKFRLAWFNGVFINVLFISLGMLIIWYKDVAHQQQWINHFYQPKVYVVATLQEPLSEKTNSFKATASVQQLIQEDTAYNVKGNIIIYFKKDSTAQQLGYGTQIIFNTTLQPIKNSGNPGCFNYEQYSALQNIHHQVFLGAGDYVLLADKNKSLVNDFLLATREKVLKIITRYISGEKEAGLAEALLVGYKDDLDKTLVQSYTNTGVVHVIAISGMHLGLIYWLLTLILAPLKKRKHTKWLSPVLVITGLWLFALLAGGGPSILRSAVMFTCIVIGQSMERKTYIYNSLAASAFILLCINPFWLWDAGFQLSYTAVLSIVIFMKPIYNLLYFKNKGIDTIWKLMAVTIAAQVLTTPVSIYHFHQFPVYFLITNLPAVPLSSLIVLLEIVLCVVAPLPALAKPLGVLLHWLIYMLNSFIEHMESLPFSLWNGLQINMLQVILLYGFIATAAYWLMQENKKAFLTSLVLLFGFLAIRSASFINAQQQQELIVYNVPKRQAIDFISGRNYFFMGDKDLLEDDFLQNFHLKPSRILHRINSTDTLHYLQNASPLHVFNNKTIAVVDGALNYYQTAKNINADVVIVSKNAPVQMAQLQQTFHCKQLVFDASNATWKVNKWKTEAANLGLSCFYVVENGAFVMKMD